uniref:Mucinlike protein putative n=1 Tax=Albugo laibachii Nc14 TaxID=890382 RepID=F0WJF9_9STRA|nr:mucinlike protein putative [Albugo laibachii Nc14]|eukprot:CCA21408.1 mucinlike protein putative [Albugo laibachii Nc14]
MLSVLLHLQAASMTYVHKRAVNSFIRHQISCAFLTFMMKHVLWLLCSYIYHDARFVGARATLLDLLDGSSDTLQELRPLGTPNQLLAPLASTYDSKSQSSEKAPKKSGPEQPSVSNSKVDGLSTGPNAQEKAQKSQTSRNGPPTTLDYTTVHEVRPQSQTKESPVGSSGSISEIADVVVPGRSPTQLLEIPPASTIFDAAPLLKSPHIPAIEKNIEPSPSSASQNYIGGQDFTNFDTKDILSSSSTQKIKELVGFGRTATGPKQAMERIAPKIDPATEQPATPIFPNVFTETKEPNPDVLDAISPGVISPLGTLIPPTNWISDLTGADSPRSSPPKAIGDTIGIQALGTGPLKEIGSVLPTLVIPLSSNKSLPPEPATSNGLPEILIPSEPGSSINASSKLLTSTLDMTTVFSRDKKLYETIGSTDQNQRAPTGSANIVNDTASISELVTTVASIPETFAPTSINKQTQEPSNFATGIPVSILQLPNLSAARLPLPGTTNDDQVKNTTEGVVSEDEGAATLNKVTLHGELDSNPLVEAPIPVLDGFVTAPLPIPPLRDTKDNATLRSILTDESTAPSRIRDVEPSIPAGEKRQSLRSSNLETDLSVHEGVNAEPEESIEELPSNLRVDVLGTETGRLYSGSDKPPNDVRSRRNTSEVTPKVAIESSSSGSTYLVARLRKEPTNQNENQRDVILYNAGKQENLLITGAVSSKVSAIDKPAATISDIKTTMSAPAEDLSSSTLRMYVRGTPLVKKAQTEGINQGIVVIGGRNRFPTDDGLSSELSQSERMIQKVIKYAASAFAGITVAFLLFFHFVLMDRTLSWQNVFWAPNSWELIYYIGYLQQMSSLSQLTLLKTPYFVWEYTDSFAWTGLLVQLNLGPGRGTITRRLQEIILGGIVSFGDRLAVREDKILYQALIGFSIVFATLLLAFFLFAICAKCFSAKRAEFPQTSYFRYRKISIRTLGLCILFWYCSLFPMTMYASFEMSMDYKAGVVFSALFVAILLLVLLCIGGLIVCGYVIMHATETDLRQDNMLALWGSLYSEFTYRSRMFFIIIAVFQITLGISVGFFDNDPGQLVAVMTLRLSYLMAVFTLNPYADALMVRVLYVMETLMILNHSLAFAFLNSTNMSTSTRYGIGDAFISINSVVILLWFIRQLIVFAAYVRSWSAKSHVEHVSAIENYRVLVNNASLRPKL